VLYNNASGPRVGPFAELTYDDWRFTLRNELDLIFTVTSAAWPHLIARGGGVVINTASVSAHRGATFIEQAAHGAAKGGVLAITRHLAASGARHGIRANSISPGLIVTPQISPFLDEAGHPVHEMLRSHPLGRLGESEDVARVALFLASDEAAYVNAVDIVVDGGQSVLS
jgi:meso-butanediol dehydrogenase/(S,S)-butanediol dehydrogenase/diacetyl reductase